MPIKKSIKTDMLIFLLALTAASISITAYIGVNSVRTAGYDIQQITAAALSTQAEKFLPQLAEEAANKNDIIFDRMQRNAGSLAAYTANIFDNPESFARENYWKFDEHIFTGEHGQHLNGMNDTSSVFISNHIAITDDLKKRVELSAYLDYASPKFLENEPHAVAIWWTGPEGEARYYPNIGLGNIAPPDEKVTEEIFFVVANPKNNPEKKVAWTPVYDDPAAQGLMITASAPIYTKKGFLGVLGIDVTLNIITKNIEEYNPIENSYSFLIDKEGRAIALPEKAYEDILARARMPGEFGANLNNVTNEFSPVISEMKRGLHGFQSINVGNKELYIAYAPLEGTGFSLGIVTEKAVLLKAVGDMQKAVEDSAQRTIYFLILPAGLLILVAAWTVGFFYIQRIINPIKKLTETAEEISKGNLNVKSDIKSKNEIGQLASTFNQMTKDLKKSQEQIMVHSEELESTVQERTSELNEKVKELEGNRTAILNMMEDVDSTNKELVKAQEKLKKSFTELKSLDQNKDTFISIAAHELKTPMTAIHGFAQLLENEKVIRDPESRNKYLKIIEHEVERLAKLVTEVLDLSRVDLGIIKFSIEDVDVAKIANEVEEELKEKVKSKKLYLKFMKEKHLPTIQTDKERLKQVLINLVDNSIKYAEKGGTTVDIAKEKDFLKFTIADKGIGIPKNRYDKMFTRFYQVENPLTRKVGGSGLGMSICKEFVEALGGKIWFESRVGKGTTFFFTLPIRSRIAEANKYQKQNND